MNVAGFNLTCTDVSDMGAVRLSFYVIDAEQGGMFIPTTMFLGDLSVPGLIKCRCIDCISLAITTWATQRIGEEAGCHLLRETADELQKWVDKRLERVEANIEA